MKRLILTFLLLFIFLSWSFLFSFDLKETRYQFYNSTENKLTNGEILRSYFLDEAPDSIFNLGNHLIVEGINTENSSWLNYGKLLIASFYTKKGKTDFSKTYLQDCIRFYERKKDYLKLSDALNLYGEMFFYKGNYELAIKSFKKSLTFASLLPDEDEAFTAHIPLSETYLILEKYQEAENEIQIFLRKAKKLKLNKALRKGYGVLAKIDLQSNRTSEAMIYFKKALDLAYLNGDKLGLSTAFNNSAIAFFEVNDLENARIHFLKALKLRLEINIPKTICESYYNLAEYYSFIKDDNKTIEYLNFSLQLAQKHNLIVDEVDAYTRLIEIYKKTNNYKKALEISNLLIEAQKKRLLKKQEKDFLLESSFHNISSQEQKLIQKNREQQLLNQIKEANKNYLMLFLFFSIIFSVLLYFLLKRSKKN